uniref:hypothetical protein n=1 Tax=Kroppenstedtia guangzhouensis TaxID=1274356 RepID=UPI00166B31B8
MDLFLDDNPKGLNYKQTFVYNDKNELVSEKDANANAKNSNATYNYTYHGKGNLTSVTNPLRPVISHSRWFWTRAESNGNLTHTPTTTKVTSPR